MPSTKKARETRRTTSPPTSANTQTANGNAVVPTPPVRHRSGISRSLVFRPRRFNYRRKLQTLDV